MDLSRRSSWKPVAMAAAVGFMGFFVWIVTIADQGVGTPWWSFIDQIPYGDKLGHLGLIGIMSFLCNLAFPSRKLAGFVTVTTLLLLIALSLEELSQGYIASRTLDVFDWLADVAGLAIGQCVALFVRGWTTNEYQITRDHSTLR